MSKDTIVALATPPGRGGVGIIRLSGPKALDIASRINGVTPLKPRIAKFCSFYNTNQDVLDQGIMLYFKAPHSFTGEDVVEIQGHGSPVVLDLLTKECIALGARMANPGEFSERAFLNDKMDLTQAEAIADLIQASSQTAARMAFKTLHGEFSNKINTINEKLIYLRMYVEAAIDFPEEEIDFLKDGKVGHLLSEIRQALDLLYRQANQGVLLQEGLNIVIAGKPNAGKSTLINYLSGRQVAIVTDIAGTTRDVMRERILLDDIPLHLIDTAGLRESDCIIEQEGIKRAWDELKKADCVLLLSDVNDTNPQLSAQLEAVIDKKIPLIKVFNKIDTQAMPPKVEDSAVYVSIKHDVGMDALKDLIKKTIGYQPLEGQFLARRRHLEAIEKAQGILEAGYRQLTEHRALELLAEDLRQAHQSLCEITGEFTSDDLLGAIFSSFCIGK